MTAVRVKLQDRSYVVSVGYRILGSLAQHAKKLQCGDAVNIVSNRPVQSLFGHTIQRSLERNGFSVSWILLPDSERAKSSATLVRVLSQLARNSRGRQPWVLALGGGVVGDLAGLAAALFRRGIPYIQCPTTLLAQVDSSVGGKVAIDLPEGKNLVGTFYHPRWVCADLRVLSSLSDRTYRSGLAEVIKYAAIGQPRLFSMLARESRDVHRRTQTVLKRLVIACVRAKSAIVTADEHDTGDQRIILNYGHTIGHALEASLGFSSRLHHGEAVAIGMVCANDLAVALDLLPAKAAKRIEALLGTYHLPTRIPKTLSVQAILRAARLDKKWRGSINRFVLLRNIGTSQVVENITSNLLNKVLIGRGAKA